MAEGLIRMRDLAASLIAAGNTPVAEGAQVAAVRMELLAFTGQVRFGQRFWDMQLRRTTAPRRAWFVRLPWIARFRRARRQRAGWSAHRIILSWTPSRLAASIDGYPVATILLTPERTSHA